MVNWKNDYYNKDGYDDRPNILSISNNKLMFKYGFFDNKVDIYYDQKSLENFKTNNSNTAIKESIASMSQAIERNRNKIVKLNNIIDDFNNNGISYSAMVNMYNNCNN